MEESIKTNEVLYACIDEMYPMGDGIFIDRPDEVVLECGNIYLTRKQVKHIIEHRKGAHQSIDEVRQLLSKLPEVILEFDFEISNTNLKYPDSILRVKVFKSWERSLVLVMSAPINGKRLIITVYPYRLIFAYFLLLKKLNTSAAGKTPSS